MLISIMQKNLISYQPNSNMITIQATWFIKIRTMRAQKNRKSSIYIDLVTNNSPHSFQNTSSFCTGLCDCYNLVTILLKTSFRKAVPKEHHNKDYNKYNTNNDLKTELMQDLGTSSSNYESFEQPFLSLLNK